MAPPPETLTEPDGQGLPLRVNTGQKIRRGLLYQPETNILTFAFLLNYPWEFLQAPFFKGLGGSAHWEAVKVCTRATVGDAFIMLFAYWSVAIIASDRWWFRRPRRLQMIGFIAVGIAITVTIDHFAIRSNSPIWGWRYAEIMPTIPVLGIGLTPLLQWLFLPALAVWFVRRQLEAREI